jgi:four helix bundle protein
MAVRHYTDLVAWQKAMDLAESAYRAAARFPREERYGITSQLQRAAVSVPCNIAEGQGRDTTKEFLHFLHIARGSVQEVQTILRLCQRIGILDEVQLQPLLGLSMEVAKLLNGLMNSLKTN